MLRVRSILGHIQLGGEGVDAALRLRMAATVAHAPGVWLAQQGMGMVAHAGEDVCLPNDAGVHVDHEAGLMVIADAILFSPVSAERDLHSAAGSIALAYRQWGEDCVRHLDGDFAFVLLDQRRQRIIAATDPMGVRPLYFASPGGREFSFASDPRVLAALMGMDARVPESRLVEQLVNPLEILENKQPLVEGTQWLEAGHVLILDTRGVSSRRYWIPGEIASGVPSPDAPAAIWVEALTACFEQAVAKRLRATTRRGVLFSGGLDSAAVLGTSRGLFPDSELDAFSLIDSGDPGCLETEAIRRTFHACSVHQHVVDCSSCESDAAAARELLPGMRRFLTGRFSFMLLSLARACQGAVHTVFDGVDGDALFSQGGARGWFQNGKSNELRRNARKYKQLGGETPSASFSPVYGALSYVLPKAVLGIARRHRQAKMRRQEFTGSCLNRSTFEAFNLADRALRFDGMVTEYQNKVGSRAQLSSMDHPTVLDGVRRFNERARAQGIQMMHPLADRALMDFCAWIPPHLRMRNGRTKWIMRKAMNKYLPHSVVWRSDKHHIGACFDRVVLQPVLDNLEKDLSTGNARIQPYIDTERVLALAKRWNAGDVGAVVGLTSLLLLEHWLQHNNDNVRWGC